MATWGKNTKFLEKMDLQPSVIKLPVWLSFQSQSLTHDSTGDSQKWTEGERSLLEQKDWTAG